MPDTPSEQTPIDEATDFLRSAAPEALVAFCLAPSRTWNASAVRAVAAVVADRSDDPSEVEAAFANIDAALDDRASERVEAIATFFAGELGAQTPPSVIEWLDFDSKYRSGELARAWDAFLATSDPSVIREELLQDPKRRVALFRHAYDAELFRAVLRDADWKGWVGEVGKEALPEICASLVEDEHTPKRHRHTVESAVRILGRGSGPLDPAEQAAWETISTRWRELFEELDLVVDHWPNGTRELFERIGAEAASEWLDAWKEADLDLPARIRVFPLLSEERQWRVVADVAALKRRSKETGDLRRAVLQLPDPVTHVAGLAKKHDVSDAELEVLQKVFRKQKAELEQALQG